MAAPEWVELNAVASFKVMHTGTKIILLWCHSLFDYEASEQPGHSKQIAICPQE